MLIWLAVIAVTVFLDQLTKYLTVLHLKPIDTLPIIEDVLHLTYVENTGAAFGMMKDARWVFMITSTLAIIGILGFFLIDEPHKKADGTDRYFANIVYGFRPSVMKQNPLLYLLLIAFALFGISIQIFMPYLILYYTEGLKMEGYVLVMAPAIILASVFTVIWGRVHDKVGFRASMLPSLGLLCAGYILLYFFRSTALVFVGSLLMMCGNLAGTAVFGAVIRDHTPEGRAGMFQGLRIAGQVLIPGLIGPAIGAWVLRDAETVIGDDGTESFIPNANIFLTKAGNPGILSS